jgi:tetratricopeptide (TPR) repeat protein
MVGNVFKVCILFICLLGSGGSTVDAVSSGQKGQKTAYDYYVSGNALYREGQYGEAILAFRKSLELNPKHYYSRANLGAALGKTGQFGKAAAEFTFCISKKWGGVGDRVAFHFNRALALEAGGNATAALPDNLRVPPIIS